MPEAIAVEGLSKRYLISVQAKSSLLSEAVSHGFKRIAERVLGQSEDTRTQTEEFWALRDVAFHVAEGDRLGVLGRNGAGKSTLLKLLSRITEPTTGRISVRGRVASLLEVGTGFHPELTGRENIYLNGIILGMTKREIQRRFDDIVQFAEIERFLDTPVKRYSSGMYVRLAFSVAAHVEADILLVDEVLAVGDLRFQEKCLSRMEESTSKGRTVLFVSHNMTAISRLCNRGLLFEQGRIAYLGDATAAIDAYVQTGSGPGGLDWSRPLTAQVSSLELICARGSLSQGESRKLRLELQYRSNGPHPDCYVVLDFLEAAGTTLMQAMPTIRPFIRYSREQPEHTVRIEIELPGLVPGSYDISVWHGPHNTETLEWWQRILRFSVLESPVAERTYPHPREHGFIVAKSRFIQDAS